MLRAVGFEDTDFEKLIVGIFLSVFSMCTLTFFQKIVTTQDVVVPEKTTLKVGAITFVHGRDLPIVFWFDGVHEAIISLVMR